MAIKKESSEFTQLPTITIRKPIAKWLAFPELFNTPNGRSPETMKSREKKIIHVRVNRMQENGEAVNNFY